MTIYKLILTQNRGWQFEPTEESFHISKYVAKNYANRKKSEGIAEYVDCGEWGAIKRHYFYHDEYTIIPIEVNEF